MDKVKNNETLQKAMSNPRFALLVQVCENVISIGIGIGISIGIGVCVGMDIDDGTTIAE